MTMEEIRADMAEKAAGIDPLGKTLAFYLDDEILLIDGTGDANVVSVATGQAIEPECSVTMSLDTFGQLGRKEIKPFMAVASGKIKVKGDLSIAAKLKKLT
ncbi:MAG: SCP2 sterol-binding domain-containing protein [Gammaproteobacteria bacterium]|nr:SCP2 sterol-binding domain-containing protein [Gammaproteobacteria bacterium]MYE83699.1 SCP2 sterol-binding domain-containing protein [Gammaproteobacteria bacterium]